MPFSRLLIANRGEIAVRVARAAAELGISTHAVFASDDGDSRHVRLCDGASALEGAGPAAYLRGEALIAIARAAGCDAVHPGYGFLAENAAFAGACARAGLGFVGPSAHTLALLGDKISAREVAVGCDVPVLEATAHAVTLDEARAFMRTLQDAQGASTGVMIKALAGGGGRGMRIVQSPDALDEAFARCASEAQAAFGDGRLYVERLMQHARHIEVQIIGDGRGQVLHAGERECSLQRRQQKCIEIAPAPSLPVALREAICAAAVRIGESVSYAGLGTVEFLVDVEANDFRFIEVNPRVQVEHTVTEMVTGLDLVQTQIAIAGGLTFEALGLSQAAIPAPRGFAVQLRINAERLSADGLPQAATGRIDRFDLPVGPGVRVDTHAERGYSPSPRYDTLLAKLIVHSTASWRALCQKAERALGELVIEGIPTNGALLRAMLLREDVQQGALHTRLFDEALPELLSAVQAGADTADTGTAPVPNPPPATVPGESARPTVSTLAQGAEGVCAPMPGVVVECAVAPGDVVPAGALLLVLEAMKMEHEIRAEVACEILALACSAGEVVSEGQLLLCWHRADAAPDQQGPEQLTDLDHVRADLQAVFDRHALLDDHARPEALARRHARGQRSARENLHDLVDAGSFVEYGALAVAAQRRRRSIETLERETQADGIITGLASVNRALFSDREDCAQRTRCAVMIYDYSVLAGTQGYYGHKKSDRLLRLVHEQQLPLISFCEGGGGRPGDVDHPDIVGLNCTTFAEMAKLSGVAPSIGIVSGYCFAGNAALLGCSDVIIATRNACIGMAGPAMIEGGGLGVYKPGDIGPVSVQEPNGVIDLLVEDEAEAVVAARQYLAYFQGDLSQWSCADQRLLRQRIPENRMRAYAVRQVIDDLADTGSVLELRPRYGVGILTCLLRIEGKAFGVIANNPQHLGGAIDAPAADKAARFIQLCNAYDLPMIGLVDTPGFMVGPDAEQQAQVRRFARLFTAGANADIPYFAVCLRKGYGLGAQAMTAGGFQQPVGMVSWPTGEFGGMGLEGAVRLGFRKELEATATQAERDVLYQRLLSEAYEHGKATRMASVLEFDGVIDPADTRAWLMRSLAACQVRAPRRGKKVPFIDPW